MIRQLILDLPIRQAKGRDDFYVAPPNALAVATLDQPDSWPLGRMLLTGPAGAGKSHLAAIWAEAQGGASVVEAATLTEADAPALVEHKAVVVENAALIAGHAAQERALFHLTNLMQAERGRLLITATAAPRDWGLTLPDLASRMEGTALVRISAPDDALLSAVLVKLFSDRQTKVPMSLIPWLVGHMDRSFEAARTLVTALDTRAVTEGRPVTRPMAADVLESLS